MCSVLVWYLIIVGVSIRLVEGNYCKIKKKLERAVDGAPSQIPTLKFLTPPSPTSPTPGHDLQQNENSVRYVLYLLFVRTHTNSLV